MELPVMDINKNERLLIQKMQKDVLVDMATNALQVLATSCDQDELEKAGELCSKFKDNIKSVKVPILTNNTEVKKYIKEFELDKIENLCLFLVESYYASFENIIEAVNGLQVENLIKVLGKITAAKDEIEIGINNPEDGREYLRMAHGSILDACGALEGLLQGYIAQLNKIDQRNKWKFFLGAKGSLSKVDTNVICARKAIEAIHTAIRLQVVVAVQLRQKNRAVIMGHIDSIKNILSDKGYDLLYAYDKDKQDGYWEQIPQRLEELKTAADTLDEYSNLEQQYRKSTSRAEGGIFGRWRKCLNNSDYK